MQLKNIQNDLREQNVFKKREMTATLKEWNAITMISKNITHENVIS